MRSRIPVYARPSWTLLAPTLALTLALPAHSRQLAPYDRAHLQTPGLTLDRFGAAIDLSGDLALVGAPLEGAGDVGAAYVFRRTGSSWELEQRLMATDADAGDEFGAGLEIDGDWALIGARLEDDRGFGAGAVYAFHRDGDVWTETQKLLASNGESRDRFGAAIAMEGSTVAIGAPSALSTNESSVYIFELVGGEWIEQQILTPSVTSPVSPFGAALDMDDGRLVVGDRRRTHVFQRAGGQWTEEAVLGRERTYVTDPDVSISGTRIVVGSRHATTLAGEAIVYSLQSGVWAEEAVLRPDPVTPVSYFGRNVSVEGHTILVGANQESLSGPGSGAAYLYELLNGSWVQQARFVSRIVGPSESFGGPLCQQGETALISAPGLDEGEELQERVFVYTITSDPGIPFCEGVACPCGNDDPSGGCINSTGQGARVEGTGSRSVATDDLVLTATGFGAGESGLWFVGADLRPPASVGDGLVCTGGLFRFAPSRTSGAGDLLLSGIIGAAPAGTIAAGDTRYFQAWSRDVLCGPPPAPCPTPCGLGSNVSSGYVVLFTP